MTSIIDRELFFVSNDTKFQGLFKFRGIDQYGKLNSEELFGNLALRLRVSIFDFYFVFLEEKVYVVRAYKNGTVTGKSAQFFTDGWDKVLNRFPLLMPLADKLEEITDEVWIQNENICRLQPSSTKLIPSV